MGVHARDRIRDHTTSRSHQACNKTGHDWGPCSCSVEHQWMPERDYIVSSVDVDKAESIPSRTSETVFELKLYLILKSRQMS